MFTPAILIAFLIFQNNTLDNSEILEDEQIESEPRQIKRKIPCKKQSQTQDDDNILKEAIEIMKKPKDDFDRFGEYVALELKNFKSDYYRGQLKSVIRKAIAHFSDMDERSYWSSVPSSLNANTSSSEKNYWSSVPSSLNASTTPVSYTHLDVYKRQVCSPSSS